MEKQEPEETEIVPAPKLVAAKRQIVVSSAPLTAPPYVPPKSAIAPVVVGLIGNLMAMLAVFLPVLVLDFDSYSWFQGFRLQAVIILASSMLGLLMAITVRGMQLVTALAIGGSLASVWIKIADIAGVGADVFDIVTPSLGSFLLVGGAMLTIVSALWPSR